MMKIFGITNLILRKLSKKLSAWYIGIEFSLRRKYTLSDIGTLELKDLNQIHFWAINLVSTKKIVHYADCYRF